MPAAVPMNARAAFISKVANIESRACCRRQLSRRLRSVRLCAASASSPKTAGNSISSAQRMANGSLSASSELRLDSLPAHRNPSLLEARAEHQTHQQTVTRDACFDAARFQKLIIHRPLHAADGGVA